MVATLLHFGISFILSTALTVAIPESPNTAIGFTVGIGIGKEVGDYMNYGQEVGSQEFAKMASYDLLVDSLGIYTGVKTGMYLNEIRSK